MSNPDKSRGEFAVFFSQDQLLINVITQQFVFPMSIMLSTNEQCLHEPLCIGEHNNHPVHAIHVEPSWCARTDGVQWVPVKEALNTMQNGLHGKLICRAKQLIHWHLAHRFCGHCGHSTQTIVSNAELYKQCGQCEQITYPSTSPAIIVLITRGDEILLGRSPHFPTGVYSLLAGFVEAGESCEEAVIREVNEEVGIAVHNIHYAASQPWPFPNSYMLGFTANFLSGSITMDPNEIEDAQWFNVNNMPKLPHRSSIAHRMIQSHLLNQLR